MKYIFPLNHRVRQSIVFTNAFRNKPLQNKWFAINIANSTQPIARLGMVVSKRTMAKSVSRNYAKRLIREVFRYNSANLPPMDFIIRIRRKLTKETSLEARSALLQLMLNAKSNDSIYISTSN